MRHFRQGDKLSHVQSACDLFSKKDVSISLQDNRRLFELSLTSRMSTKQVRGWNVAQVEEQALDMCEVLG